MLWLFAGAATAATERVDVQAPFDVTGDEVEYQAERDVYIARGNVEIKQRGRTLTADRVIFNDKTKTGVAIGHVKILEGPDTLEADFLEFDVDDLRGVVFHGRLDSAKSNYVMTGEEVRKTGDQTYSFDRAHFSTCRCPDPTSRQPWALTAQNADLELDGYAHARNATFEVFGVPILWWPYVLYPLKRERETGFLFPDFGSTNQAGTYVALPFFWAARDNVNVLLRPEWEEKRGFKPSADAEYVFGERAGGEFYATFIHDQDIDPHDPKTPFSQDRWAGSLRHLQDLPGRGWLALDGSAVSDNLYTLDFRDFIRNFPDEYIRSVGFGGAHVGANARFAFTAGVVTWQDLQNQDDRDRDKVLLQRLPTVSFDAQPEPIPALPGLVASSGIEFARFAPFDNPVNRYPRSFRVDDQWFDTGADAIPDGRERNAGGVSVPYDANLDNGITERNGRFDEGEPLADNGARLIAHPRLAYPLRLGDLLDVYPEVGYYGTYYDTDLQGLASRSLLTGRLDLSTEVRGSFDLPFGFGAASHLIVPHVTWVGVSSAGQKGNPLFVPETAVPQDRLRELEVDNVTLDPSDRIHDANTVVMGVSNRFFRLEDSSLLGELELSGEYRAADRQWGPAVLQGSAQLPAGLRMRFQGVYEVDQTKFTDGLVDFGWQHPYGHGFSLGYRYLTEIPHIFEAFTFKDERYQRFDPAFKLVNQINGSVRIQLTHQWAVTYLGTYSFENSFSLTHRFGIEYLSQCRCWAARLEFDDTVVRGLQWHLQYRLLGIGDDASHPFSGRGSQQRFQQSSSGRGSGLF